MAFQNGHPGYWRGKHFSSEHIANRSRSQSGKSNGRWNGGRFLDKNGYVMVLTKGHPFANRFGYVREHRLVMEHHLGRYLKPEERVHHLNNDHKDNRIENLRLFGTPQEHIKFHAQLRLKTIVLCPHCQKEFEIT